MNSKLLIIGLVIIVALAGLLLFTQKPSDNTPEIAGDSAVIEVPSPAPTDSPSTSSANLDEQVITMDAGSFYYSVKEIKATQGQKIKIVMTSKDMMHDFNIDELKVKSGITQSGDTTTVEFVADQVGTFEYYCSVGQHRQNGQVGQLIVE